MKSVWPDDFYRILCVCCLICSAQISHAQALKVGVPDNPPLSFKDREGIFQGVYVELVNQIANEQNWTLHFESISLADGLEQLHQGHLDLLLNVPYNATYQRWVDYSTQGPVLEWGVIATLPENNITNLFDVRQKSVALAAQGQHSAEFIGLGRDFHIVYNLVAVESVRDAVQAVVEGRADVAVVSNLYLASLAANEAQLVPTPIIFNPTYPLVAVPRNQHAPILHAIDESIAIWKQTPGSFLYQTLDNWVARRDVIIPPLKAFNDNLFLWILLGTVLIVTLGLSAQVMVWILRMRRVGGVLALTDELAELRRSEQRYRGFIDNIPFGLVETDIQGNLVFANAMDHQIRRYKQGELQGKNLLDMAASLAEKEKMRAFVQKLVSEQPFPVEPYLTSIIRKDGRRADLRYEWNYKRTPQGELEGLYALVTDVTETMQLKNKILDQQKDLKRTADQRANDLLRAYNDLLMAGTVFDNTAEGILVMDLDLILQSVNPAFSKMTGFTEQEVEGQKLSILASKKFKVSFFEKLAETLRQKGAWQGEVWPGRRNGDMFPGWMSISAVRDAHEQSTQYVAMLSDITKRKQYERQIWRQANFDALTGLPNRNLFHQRLSQAIQAAKQDSHIVALMFIDLDKFKGVNDTLGHDAGDELLKAATRRISSCVEKNDTIARMGGDEFTVILPHIANERRAALVAGKILAELNRPFDIFSHLVEISGSIGIVLFPQNGNDLTALLKNADIAMYHIKESGRNNFCFFSEVVPTRNP